LGFQNQLPKNPVFMRSLIEDFPQQLQAAGKIALDFQFKQAATDGIQNIVIAGLGGSGIGAELVQNYVQPRLALPVVVCKAYHLPGLGRENTLDIACSYSMNNEDSLLSLQ